MKSDFCIVGGGVSGLVAALILERYFPKKKINLIYSKHHKEIGVGESTNETWDEFITAVQIDPGSFYAYCDGTPKIAIKQKNWLRDNHEWFHYCTTPTNIIEDYETDNTRRSLYPLPEPAHYWSKRLSYNIDPEEEAQQIKKYTYLPHRRKQ